MMDGKPSERLFRNLIDDEKHINMEAKIHQLEMELLGIKAQMKKMEWEIRTLWKQYFKQLDDGK